MYFLVVAGPVDATADAIERAQDHLRRVGAASRRAVGLLPRLVEDRVGAACFLRDASSSFGKFARDDQGVGAVGGLAGEAAAMEYLRTGSVGGIGSPEFAAVRCVSTSDSTTIDVAVDRYASVPVYWGRVGDVVAASGDAFAVAFALRSTEVDDGVAFELLRYTHAVGLESTIRHVSRIPPGSALNIRVAPRGTSQQVSTWCGLGYAERPTEPDLADLFGALRRGADDVLSGARALGASVEVQISGGLDSRLTAAAAAAVCPGVRAVTYDFDTSETRIASAAAARLSLEHHVVSLAEAESRDLEDGFLLTGGQVAVHAAAGNILGYRALHSSAAPLCLVGAWPGDVLAGSYVPYTPGVIDPGAADQVTATWSRRRGYPSAVVARLVDQALVAQRTAPAKRKVRSWLAGRSEPTAAQRITMWALLVRQPAFSFVSPARLLPGVVEATPCLAPAFVDAFLGLPAVALVGKSFYRSLVWDAAPALRPIPYAATGMPIDPSRRPAPSRRALPALARDLLSGAADARVARHAAALAARFVPSASSAEITMWRDLLAGTGWHEGSFVSRRARRRDPLRSMATRVDVQLAGALTSLAWTQRYLSSGGRNLT